MLQDHSIMARVWHCYVALIIVDAVILASGLFSVTHSPPSCMIAISRHPPLCHFEKSVNTSIFLTFPAFGHQILEQQQNSKHLQNDRIWALKSQKSTCCVESIIFRVRYSEKRSPGSPRWLDGGPMTTTRLSLIIARTISTSSTTTSITLSSSIMTSRKNKMRSRKLQ